MFSTGQLIFAIAFVIAFAIVLFVSYRRDRPMHQKNYRGVKWVFLTFLAFIFLLFAFKFFLHN